MENKKLNIAFYITHPSHVYLWMSIAKRLKSHNVFFITKPKDDLLNILDSFNVNYQIIGKHQKVIFMKVIYLLKQVFLIYKYLKKQEIDLCIGMYSFDLSIASKLTKSKCLIMYSDNKHHWKGDKLEEVICNYFADFIVCPSGCEKLNKKVQFSFNGVCNLAYLHPNYFKPNIEILKIFRLKQPYIIIKDKLGSSLHDYFSKNVIDIDYLISKIPLNFTIIQISNKAKIKSSRYITLSGNSDIHHILYHTELFIGDSALMAHEASVLGVPTLVLSDKKHGRNKHLTKYGILETFNETKSALKRVNQILSDEIEKQKWKENAKDYIEAIGDTQNCILDGICIIIDCLQKEYGYKRNKKN